MSPDKLPYPPGPDPDDVPLDRPAGRHGPLFAAQLLFLGGYGFLIAGLLAVAGSTAYLGLGEPLFLLGPIVCLPPAAFLVKCLFRPPPPSDEPDLAVETDEDAEPVLWAFVRRLAEDVGADEPRRLFLIPDANAAVRRHVSPLTAFAPPGFDLYLGLGLANRTTLGEFKFVLAHELAHAADAGFVPRADAATHQWLENIAHGTDLLDRVLPNLPVVSGAAGLVLRTLGAAREEARRDGELAADRSAAAVAGTAAGVTALHKTAVGAAGYAAAVADAGTAADHRIYTADLYFHMHAAVRRQPDPTDADHPHRAERAAALTDAPVPCPADDRSPWVLFADPADTRRTMTAKVLRQRFGIPKSADRTDPRTVQAFLDDDRRSAAIDPKYQGVYDDRFLRPGDLHDLDAEARRDPWDDARLGQVFEKLYLDAGSHAAARASSRAERRLLAGRAKRLKDVEARLAKAGEWFDSLDRRAYSVFVRMAARVGGGRPDELATRYRFQLAVQEIVRVAGFHHDAAAGAYRTALSDRRSDPADLSHALTAARAALRQLLRDARDIDIPPLPAFDPGERLADFLLPEDVVTEPPAVGVRGMWVATLLRQLDLVRGRATRLHVKGLTALLRLHEQIAAEWRG